MPGHNKVYVRIRGRGFHLMADDSMEYLREIAQTVDRRMEEIIIGNPRMNFEKAALLTALNFCDDLEKYKKNGRVDPEPERVEDHVREQVMEYAKELQYATEIIRNLEQELEQVKSEQQSKLDQIRREYAVREKELLDMIESM